MPRHFCRPPCCLASGGRQPATRQTANWHWRSEGAGRAGRGKQPPACGESASYRGAHSMLHRASTVQAQDSLKIHQYVVLTGHAPPVTWEENQSKYVHAFHSRFQFDGMLLSGTVEARDPPHDGIPQHLAGARRRLVCVAEVLAGAIHCRVSVRRCPRAM